MFKIRNSPKFVNLSISAMLLMIFFVFYWEHLRGNVLIPFDSKDQCYPFAVFVQGSYHKGELPLWNPYLYSGTPSFADPLYASFYPSTLLMALLHNRVVTPALFDWIELLHGLIGAFSVFFLMRELQGSSLTALFAACVYMLGGPMIARLQHATQIYTMGLFPLSLLFIVRGISRNQKWRFVVAGTIAGCYLMIGYQVAVFCMLLVVGYVAIYLLKNKENPRGIIPPTVAFFLVAMGISAIQLIPTLEFSRYSSRPRFDYSTVSIFSVEPTSLFTLVFPNFFNTMKGVYWGPADITESYLFIGGIPFLAFVFYFWKWKELKWEHRFFGIAAIVFLLLAFGKYTPMHYILYNLIPPLQLFKRPSDAFFISHFAISICSGIGLQKLIEAEVIQQFHRRIIEFLRIFGLPFLLIQLWGLSWISGYKNTDPSNAISLAALAGFLLVFLYFCYPNTRQLGKFILVMVAITELISTNKDLRIKEMPTQQMDLTYNTIYHNGQIADFLRIELGNSYRFAPVYAGSLWPNAPAVFGVSSITGYSPLVIGRYDVLVKPNDFRNGNFLGLIDGYSSRLLDLLSVKYIVSAKRLQELDPKVNLTKFREIIGLGYNVYQNLEALPLAFWVNDARCLTKEEDVIAAITDSTFDPSKEVIIESFSEGECDLHQEGETVAQVEITQRTNNTIEIEVATEKEGFLVLTDNYYPGWKAFIDGGPTQLYRANYTFKSVYIPKGHHVIELVFMPNSLRLGGGVSIVTLGIVLFYFLSLLIRHVISYK